MSISPTSLKIAALSGLLALGAGVGVATASAETTPTPSSTSSTANGAVAANEGTTSGTTDDQGPRGGRKGGRGIDAAALATALGLDEAKVTAAVTAAHEATRPEAPAAGDERTAPTEAERTAREKAFAAALATELGIDEAKVTAALADLREAHQAEHRAELSTQLDAAVTSGTLTSADKASVLKAFDAGVLKGGPGAR
jgi:hypothetical protein